MFRKNQRPVLTATSCNEMENVRLAIEVLTGQPVRLIHFDFNTGHAKAYVGDEEKSFSYCSSREDLFQFAFDDLSGWNTARFDKPREARVINFDNPLKHGRHSMWWVGRSATDRWKEPVFFNDVEYCAKVRGLSMEEYLNL